MSATEGLGMMLRLVAKPCIATITAAVQACREGNASPHQQMLVVEVLEAAQKGI
jgi:hypothetical protein